MSSQKPGTGAGPSNSGAPKPTYNGPYYISKPKYYQGKFDDARCDIEISASGVYFNRANVTEKYPIRQHLPDITKEDLNLTTAEFLAGLANRDLAGKTSLFKDLEIEIIYKVKPDSETRAAGAVEPLVDAVRSLGPEFAKHAKKLIVSLVFPPVPGGPVVPSIQTQPGKVERKKLGPESMGPPPADVDPQSANYTSLTELAKLLNTFSGMKSLVVLLKPQPRPAKELPVHLSEAFMVLPFYNLNFTQWEVKLQPLGPGRVFQTWLGHWAVTQCDKQNAVVYEKLQQLKKAATK